MAAVRSAQGAAEKVRRAANVARVSGLSLLSLGGISLLVSLLHPLSAGFLISAAVVVNGLVEWRSSRNLRALDRRAPAWLAWNQLSLGVEIALYAAWQALHLDAVSIEAILRQPVVRSYLRLLDPDLAQLAVTVLPVALRALYVLVGTVAVLGCAGTTLYYYRRKGLVDLLAAAPPPLSG